MAVVLYKRQRDILEFVDDFIKRNNFSPTLMEIGKALGMSSPATVHEHLRSLEKKGVIKRHDGSIRGIEIIYNMIETRPFPKANEVELPLLGYIHAGKPLEPYDDPNATFTVTPNLVPPNKKAYVLQVKGESMIEDGILPGDYVVLIKEQAVNNGDVVVALIMDDKMTGLATLKRYYKESDKIKLMPANAKMEPIYAKEVQIQGKLCALVRKYA